MFKTWSRAGWTAALVLPNGLKCSASAYRSYDLGQFFVWITRLNFEFTFTYLHKCFWVHLVRYVSTYKQCAISIVVRVSEWFWLCVTRVAQDEVRFMIHWKIGFHRTVRGFFARFSLALGNINEVIWFISKKSQKELHTYGYNIYRNFFEAALAQAS